jgi:hypothetical protein
MNNPINSTTPACHKNFLDDAHFSMKFSFCLKVICQRQNPSRPLRWCNYVIIVRIGNGFKDSRKNKFTFLGVEAPTWQGAKAQKYRDISALWQHCQAGCIGA